MEWHCIKPYSYYYFKNSEQLCKANTFIVRILQMRKLRQGGIKTFSQGPRAYNFQNQKS